GRENKDLRRASGLATPNIGYQALQPHIARAYHLSYDEGQRMTVAEEGYFWKDASHASSGAES
ncbi:MAG: hypothetical protein ACXVB2_24290, partial [Isosphaeraceae bacterium]